MLLGTDQVQRIACPQEHGPREARERRRRSRRERGGERKPGPQALAAVIVELGHHLPERARIMCAFPKLPMEA